MSRRLTKQACAELRTELRDLGYGQAEGETPDLFGRRLYPIPEHLRALDPNVVLVVGPRGSGKSELFNAFFKHGELGGSILRYAAKPVRLTTQPASAAWIPAYPAGTEFPDSAELGRRIESDTQAKTLWHVMLTRRLNNEFHDSVRKQLEPLTAPPAAALGTIFRVYQELPVSLTAVLDLVEKRLQQEDRWIFVGYDELDTLGGSNWDLMARLVRGLVAFWSEYGRRWQRIRAKIFLRSDLFRRHSGMGTADFAKLAANRSELAWSDANLLGMLVKRIANTSAPLADYCRGARIAGSSGFRVDEVVTDDTGGVEVKAAEVKVDGVAEPLPVAKAVRCVLQPLHPRVDRLRPRVAHPLHHRRHDPFQMPLDHPRYPLDRLQPTPDRRLVPPLPRLARPPAGAIAPQRHRMFLVAPVARQSG